MNSPLQITLRDVARSEVLERRIREQAAKLERLFADIVGCRVDINHLPGAHGLGTFAVRVDLYLPGEEISTLGTNADVQAAVREAFGHAARHLQSYAQRLRGHQRSRAGTA